MGSRYEEKINKMAVTLERIDERTIQMSNRLYDKDGDIPQIRDHIKEINGQVKDHEKRITQNTDAIKKFPLTILSKKGVWIPAVVIILSLIGLNVSDIKEIIQVLVGI